MEIFTAARKANAVVLTKDADFPFLLAQNGAPPKVVWLTCGNTSNDNLKRILTGKLPAVLKLLTAGEEIVEITG
jgi:predicted nuclease of predicted toxin-antitoxin system